MVNIIYGHNSQKSSYLAKRVDYRAVLYYIIYTRIMLIILLSPTFLGNEEIQDR